MRRLPCSVLMLLLLTVVLPGRAYASLGWWDWLEQLSGPGPFANGWMLDQRVACLVDAATTGGSRSGRTLNGKAVNWMAVSGRASDKSLPCLTNAAAVLAYVEVRGGRITTDRQALFSDVPGQLVGTVAANTIQTYVMRQFDAFAIGAGAGTMWFTGEKLDGHAARFVFTPISAAFMPLQLLLRHESERGRFLVIRFEEVALVGRLSASDFNSQSTSKFQTKSELVRSVSVTFDVLALMKRK